MSDNSMVRRLYLLSLALGFIVAWASLRLRLETQQDTIYNLTAVLHGEPFRFGDQLKSVAPFYNRVMFPLIFESFSSIGSFLSKTTWYFLLRIASFQIAFISFVFVCLHALRSSNKDCALAMTLLALSVVASCVFKWEEPSDALDLLALCLGVFAVLANDYLMSLLLAILFATNRESAAFIGVMWAFLGNARPGFNRRLFQGASISAISYACAILLRMYIAGSESVSNLFTPLDNFTATVHGIIFLNPRLILLASITTALLVNINFDAILAHRFVVVAGAFAAAALIFGIVTELRVFQPCFLMLAFAIAAEQTNERHIEANK